MNLCACGCGEVAPLITKTSVGRGYVKGQQFKFVVGHNARRIRYTVDAGTGCWNWDGRVSKDGYALGSLTRVVNGVVRQAVAHRIYYEVAKGPIPDGLVLDHLCRNRRCVNPDHLEPVSQKENVRRSARVNKALRRTT